MSKATKEYARALADLAAEEGLEDTLRTQAAAVREILEGERGYCRLLANPEIPKAERVSLLREAFGGRVHPYLTNFLSMLTERGYAYRCADFLAEYERIYCERHQITTAVVTSAVPLSDSQKTRLREKLCQLTGKTVTLVLALDPSLIGGVRVQMDNTLLEDSVRGRLDDMRAALSDITL